MDTKRGFSLVELSIVLVILGLLVGGILAGQSLIRASELRAVNSEYQRYQTAVMAFRDKYFAAPGDMKNATAFWGRLNANADCVTNSSAAVNATAGTCDGSGDGMMDLAAAASQSGEFYQFWRQLSLAGLVEGSFTGLNGAGFVNTSIIGTNVPASKLSGGGWSINYAGSYAGDSNSYKADYGNFFTFGGNRTNNSPRAAILKPEEAWNIDTKMDDGKPGTGKLTIVWWPGCTNATALDDYVSGYKLADTTAQCSLNFMRVF